MKLKVPTKAKNMPAPTTVARSDPGLRRCARSALVRLSARHRRRALGQRAAQQHHGGGRQQRQQAERRAPADRGGDEADPDAAGDPADDQRRRVGAHRHAAERRREDLGDVGDADDQQPRHAQPLQRSQDEQQLEARRDRDQRGGHDEQGAGRGDGAAAADAIGDRPPQPAAGGDGRHDDRHAQTRPRGRDAELPPQLGQDRLGRVHRGKHGRGAEQEPAHRGGSIARRGRGRRRRRGHDALAGLSPARRPCAARSRRRGPRGSGPPRSAATSSGMKPSITSRCRDGLAQPARAQVEELLGVDLGDRRGVRAAHVVGEDLQARDRVGVRALGEQQVAALLEGVGLLGARVDLDHPAPDRGRAVGQDAAEGEVGASCWARRAPAWCRSRGAGGACGA